MKNKFPIKSATFYLPSREIQTNNKYCMNCNSTICYACQLFEHRKVYKKDKYINVTDGWFDGTGPLACLSLFSVMLWIIVLTYLPRVSIHSVAQTRKSMAIEHTWLHSLMSNYLKKFIESTTKHTHTKQVIHAAPKDPCSNSHAATNPTMHGPSSPSHLTQIRSSQTAWNIRYHTSC